VKEAKASAVRPPPQVRINLEQFLIAPVTKESAKLKDVQVEDHEGVFVSLRIIAQNGRLLIAAKERRQGGNFPGANRVAIADLQDVAIQELGNQRTLVRVSDRHCYVKEF
jgi:hypothetical protein